MEFSLNLKLKKNETPKNDKSPNYWVDAPGMRGVAWDAIDERTGAKGVSIRVFREVREEPKKDPLDKSDLDKKYDELTAREPDPSDMPF